MPGWLNIQITQKKNGQEAAWFKDTLGRRVGTRKGIDTDNGWVTAEQLSWLANYWIELQNDQLDKALGSDGSSMPALSGGNVAVFDHSGGKPRFVERLRRGYQGKKVSLGLNPKRDLYGPGVGGHMRDDIRINYLDDHMAKISITRLLSRQKALANERKYPWWGLSPENSRKFAEAMATVFGGAMEDYLDQLGLVQAGNYLTQVARALNSRRNLLRKLLRKVAA